MDKAQLECAVLARALQYVVAGEGIDGALNLSYEDYQDELVELADDDDAELAELADGDDDPQEEQDDGE